MSLKTKMIVTGLAVMLASPALAGSFSNLKTSSGENVGSLRAHHYETGSASAAHQEMDGHKYAAQEPAAGTSTHDSHGHQEWREAPYQHPHKTQNFNKNR